jgi:hypothetical protein
MQMDAQTLQQRRIPMSVAIGVIVVIVTLTAITAVYLLRRTPQPIATRQASSASSLIRTGASAPWLLSREEASFLARRGATSAELAAENQQRWHRLQLRMLADPWVIGLLRHRPGMSMIDLAGTYLSRR